ncbi:MAG TPA: hypothetical protein VLX92_28200 [Kofleriaceae bacterium]|nr:hypothetical protein [Kofleriaceae bacterium]
MRAAILVLVAACRSYDPVAEIPHREVADTAAAIQLILAENPVPKVYAIGEYHESRSAVARTSPLARFTQEIIALLEPYAHHLVVEAWLDDACRSSAQLARDVTAATGRPAATEMELLRLVSTSRRMQLEPHGLPMTCIEHDAVLDAHHRVDFLLLLEIVTQKLHDTTRALLAADPDHAVIVYGGALHNDLYPHWPLDELSYAKPLAQELGRGGVLEIDLVVPEVVAGMRMVRNEPWFPLIARASPSRVLVWKRGPSSYVVILPAQSESVAKVAKPLDVM